MAAMVFETVRDAITTFLVANQAGLYQAIEGQKQSMDAEEFKGVLRLIQVYYAEGEYNQSRSSMQKLQHDCTYTLVYNVSSPAKGDLATLESETATPAQKQTALAAVQIGYVLADRLMDEFRRIITQLIMAPQNQDFGLTKYTLSNRWLTNFRKTQPINKGNLVIIEASENITCRVSETLTGVTPTPGVQPVIDLTNEQRPLNDEGQPAVPPKSGVQTQDP